MTAAGVTMTLVEFLLARVAEDEAAAWAAADAGKAGHWGVDGPALVSGKWWVYATGEKFQHEPTARHIARWDPARVLAECAAKREIVSRHNPCDDWSYGDPSTCPELSALALPYADHPDHREEWKP